MDFEAQNPAAQFMLGNICTIRISRELPFVQGSDHSGLDLRCSCNNVCLSASHPASTCAPLIHLPQHTSSTGLNCFLSQHSIHYPSPHCAHHQNTQPSSTPKLRNCKSSVGKVCTARNNNQLPFPWRLGLDTRAERVPEK